MPYAQLAVAAYGAYQAYKNKPSDEALRMMKGAMAQLEAVPVPDPATLKVQMQQLVQQGLVKPEDAQAVMVQHNAYDEANGSDEARGAQLGALRDLQDKYQAGGLTDTDRASIQATLDATANTERGQNQAITQDARRRGVSGSGLELASKLISQQSSADQAGRRGMDTAALAEQAKMKALEDAANLGGNIESQTFQEQSSKATAANQIAEYNATNQQQVTLQNIAARNAAQAANLAEKQRVADTNTTMENANRVRNSDLIQQNYTNRLDKAKAVAAAATGGAQAASTYDASKRAADSAFTSGVLNTVSNYGANGGFSGAADALKGTYDSAKNAVANWSAPKYDPSTGPGVTAGTSYLDNAAAMDPTKKKIVNMAHGGKVPGEAAYPGDTEANDTVLAKLSPGETVVPRSQSDEVDSFLNDVPRTAQKPSVDAVKTLLQALTEMGC